MPIDPMHVELSNGQQLAALKRFRQEYQDKFDAVEVELRDLLTKQAESEFLAKYLGEQPEVVEMRADAEQIQRLERRRQHLAMLIERLDQVIPEQKDVKLMAPADRVRRY